MSNMRLVDYVAIVGLDISNQRNKSGKIIQRFPLNDWPDTCFIDGLELFCQPLGWNVLPSSRNLVPKIFHFVLTDIDGERHYCACLTFFETIVTNNPANETFNNQDDRNTLYAPKCIVLVSRFDYKEVFKNCLSILYAVHVDNLRYSLETIIANLLTNVKVPPYGQPSIRFSLSAGDYLTLQPPLKCTIPTTSTSVYKLIDNIGIDNLVILFYGLITEHKILFFSQSYNRLNEACRGLIALLYPFNYSHTYIPILPATLIEVLSTPTPFIIGVHSSLKKEICDLLDVIVVDLDGGSVKVPDSLHIPHLEEPYHTQLTNLLIYVFKTQIVYDDDAFISASQNQIICSDVVDKQIRAVFLRTITQILHGYRSCLSVIRIHPKSLISFHKALFLGQRGFVDNEFMSRLLDSMFFEKFVESRGLPYRKCDLFDFLHNTLHMNMKIEKIDTSSIRSHINNLAEDIRKQENSDNSNCQKVMIPSDEVANKPLKRPFPLLDSAYINKAIEERNSKLQTIKENFETEQSDKVNTKPVENGNVNSQDDDENQFVPPGLTADEVRKEFNANEFVINSARRLEVMRNCVNCIFDNKISDARKALPAVLKALKNKSNRLALIDELAYYSGSQRAILEHQQFDLVVRLMNCALQHEGSIDLNGVAAKILPLAMEFCRRLSTGLMQFAFTCIQDHPVWSSLQFWESSFYLDVEKDMIALYKPQSLLDSGEDRTSDNLNLHVGVTRGVSPGSLSNQDTIYNAGIKENDSAMEVASKQIKLSNLLPEKQKQMLIERCCKDEEATVYSQALHYAHRIVCMKLPLDISTKITSPKPPNTNNSDSNMGPSSSQRTHSIGSDRNSNSDEESGFEDEMNNANFGNSEVAASVVKFASRFSDKVCVDSCVGEEHIKALHAMIPQYVAMQIETLEPIYKESKRLPPVMKPKIVNPDLIETENFLMFGLRTYLLPDGRDKDNVKDESIASYIGGPLYLPAEGAIFITNYRVIFKGRPCDPFYCEQTVVRSFPTTTLTKEKRITIHDVPAVDQVLRDGLQLRSNTFQLIRIAFDEEVSSESIELFRKHLNRLKAPVNKLQLFAFTSQTTNLIASNLIMQSKSKSAKSATLKGFAKRTYMKTAQKVGLKKKEPNKNRIPAIVWEHKNGAMLLRSGGFQSKSVFDSIKKPGQTLYIMTEKAQIKSVKPEMHRSCEFIPLELHDVRQVKANFPKLLRACVPSAPIPINDSTGSFAKQIESTEWFPQLKNILDCSNKLVDLLDREGKSVLLSIEDNWELTPQITSIALICLDPYYRTFIGFKALVEKEWVEFGHRFSLKSSFSGGGIASSFTLMFLQFLDLVHQIQSQYPLSFEFNQYYLKFIAYHHVSCRFSTFLLDSNDTGHNDPDHPKLNQDEAPFFNTISAVSLAGLKSNCSSSSSEVSEALQGNVAGSWSNSGNLELPSSPRSSASSAKSNASDGKTLKPTPLNLVGRSFWDYVEKIWNKSPIFFNYYYIPVNVIDPTKTAVLQPSSSLAQLKLWDYLTCEELLHGPSYDIEVYQMAKQHQEEIQASGEAASKRRLIVSNYDCIHLTQPDGLTQLMSDMKAIESEYSLNLGSWTQIWSKIESSLPVD